MPKYTFEHVTTYCRDVLYDVDNVLKWTLDGLNENERPLPSNLNNKQKTKAPAYKSIYKDDAQIYKVTSERVSLKTDALGSSPAIVNDAVASYNEFLHIVLIWED